MREILNLYRQTPIGNRSIPRGNFPFPSPFSMDGAQPSWKREGGREGGRKKIMLPSSYVSADNAIKENPILRITVNRFSSFWLVFPRKANIAR